MRKNLGSEPGLHTEMADRGYFFARRLAGTAASLAKRGRCEEGLNTFEDAVYYLGKADAHEYGAGGTSAKLQADRDRARKAVAKARMSVHKSCRR